MSGLRAPLDQKAVTRIVAALCLSTFAEWLGSTAVLPLLPVYLRHHGSSTTLVGVTMAAFFAAALAVQYPIGRLSDRIGRRQVQIGGLVVFAVATVLFAFSADPIMDLLFRALQGCGAGVVDVANAATIGEVVPDTHRGRAFGVFWGCRTVAMAVGPFFGGIAGLGGMRWVFLGGAAAAFMATVPIVLAVPARRASDRPLSLAPAERTRLWRNRSFLGVAVAFAAVGIVVGVYETCWSLLLTYKGASALAVGVSWALFALPFAVMSFPAGWLVDKLDRRYLVGFALTGSAVFAMTYPWLGSVALIIALGSLEAVLTAIGTPAEQAQLAHSVQAAELGRAQGAAASAQTAATAVAALLSGTLFGVHPWLPFVGGSVVIVLAVGLLGVFWRGVNGRVSVAVGSAHHWSPEPPAELAPEPAGPLAS
ncbi:MAG: MFS transporter [Acidimicrobiales bacterium]